MSDVKKPEENKPDDVKKPEENKPASAGIFKGINRPTAGARSERDLPVGKHPLQLYSLATPNGQKVTLALEELGVKYDAWPINIMKEDQFTTGFVAVNPNSKIPAMVDKEGPGGKPINLFESGAILLYLAEKYGKLIPKDPATRVECLNFLFFNIGAAPFLGQFGHFYKYAPEKIEYGINRYAMEAQRIMDVLDKHLAGKTYLVNEEYTIADIAWWPWIRCLDTGYSAKEFLGLDKYKNMMSWFQRCLERPVSAKALRINSLLGDNPIPEYHSE